MVPGPVGGHEVDLADLADRHVVAGLVEDAHAAPALGQADRPGVRERLRSGDRRAALALGAAVALADPLRPEPADPALLEPHRPRRPGAEHLAQRRHVVGLPVGQVPDPVHHRGDEEHPRDAVRLDQAQRLGRVEALHHDDGAPDEEPEHREAERTVVVQRSGHELHVALGHLHRGHVGVELRGHRGDDELGPPGRPARGHRLEARPHHARHRLDRLRPVGEAGFGGRDRVGDRRPARAVRPR